jgi:D-alanyl-D-alanine carboxypeptidase (penicillin-binding protein 5/6)
VLFARRPAQERPIASTTKLMTALLTVRHLGLHQVLTASDYGLPPVDSQIGLRPGERMRVSDLLRALFLPSADDAALDLADGVAGSAPAFVAMMNAQARRLGLRHTHYANPIGLDAPGNYSTASDLVALARVVRRNRFIDRTTRRTHVRLRSGAVPRVVTNRNDLVGRLKGMNGVKTGHTNRAGYLLVGSATRHGTTYLTAVLHDPSEADRDRDTARLMRYAFRRFRLAHPLHAGRPVARRAVTGRPDVRVALVPARSLAAVLPRGTRARLRIHAAHDLDGPLKRGALVGSVTVRAGDRTLRRVPLRTARAVPAPPAASIVTRPALIVPVVFLLALGALGLRRARVRARRRPRQPAPGARLGAPRASGRRR